MKRIALALLTIAIFARPIAAEPIGQWYSGFGQGTVEYGIKTTVQEAIIFTLLAVQISELQSI